MMQHLNLKANSNRSSATMAASLTILLILLPTCIEARSWWSLEIPAIEDIKMSDPLYAPSSTLFMEDTSFLYGGAVVSGGTPFMPSIPTKESVDADADPTITYSTPTVAPDIEPEVTTSDNEAGSPVPVHTDPTSSATVGNDSDSSVEPPSIQAFTTDSPTAAPVQQSQPVPSPQSVATKSPETPFPTATVHEPTFSPSLQFESANGSCASGSTLHRVWLYDTANDGWGSTTITIQEMGKGFGALLAKPIFVGSLDRNRGVIKFDVEGDNNLGMSHDKTTGGGGSSTRYLRREGGSRRRTSLASGFVSNRNPSLETQQQNDSEGESLASEFLSKRNNNPLVEKVQPSPQSMTNDFDSSSSAASGFAQRNTPQADTDGTAIEAVSRAPNHESSPFNESLYLCLKQDVCYTAMVSGGTFLEEARWEITRVELGTGENVELVAEGVGEGTGVCGFSLDGSCAKTCDGTVQMIAQTSSPVTAAPSKSPSSSPTMSPSPPTNPPTPFLSRKPTTGQPTEIPDGEIYAFGIEEYRRVLDVIMTTSPNSKKAMKDGTSHQFRAFEWLYSSNTLGLSDVRVIQRWVLASFYYATNGDEWINQSGWFESKNECLWYGVTCLDGVISRFELDENHLVGTIIPEIVVWADDLYVLSLGNNYDTPAGQQNKLDMPLPSFLGSLSSLRFLNLEGVGLTSTISEELFSSWTHLESLYLNNNDLTGELPQSIKHLASIEVLWIGGNNLSGPIVSEIGQLSNLKDLSLESNYRENVAGKRGFITAVPPEIGQLTKLESLSLANNALSGQVPMQLGDLISLRRLQLGGNFFESQLPPALGKLEMLEELDISSNWLSSTIPLEYGNMISLTKLSLQSNYKDHDGYFTWGIKGKLPTELGNLKNLQHMDISDNYLTGSLVTEIGKLYLLQTMHLQNNFLQGPIPSEWANCVSMKEMFLQDNNVDGQKHSVPEEICRLPELELARVDCAVSCSCCLSC